MTETLTTSETLNKAADLIEERGWAAGVGWTNLLTSTGPVCIQGALAAAMGVDNAVGWRCPAYHAVADYLGIESGLFIWNDSLLWVQGDFHLGLVGDSKDAAFTYGREQVIATLRAAALIEAAKETAADPLVAHLAHHAVDIIAAELDTTAAPL